MSKIGEEKGSGFNPIEIYLREIGQTSLLTREEECELARRIKRGDQHAREQMIKANLRLVVKLANDYSEFGLPLLDLVSEGNIGLMKAAEHFKPNKGAKFSTYASWWIKQAIRRALSNQAKTIRIPVHTIDKISKLRRVTCRLEEGFGRKPTPEELAEVMGLSPSMIEHLQKLMPSPLSLDQKVGDDADSGTLGEVIKDPTAPMPFDRLEQVTRRSAIEKLLGELNDRERDVLSLRFGLLDGKQWTLENIGKRFRLTRERIRQIQDIALGKLQSKYMRLVGGNGHNDS